jgi:ATP diphosphatase
MAREYGWEDLLAIMRRLRDPGGGCPWDLRQTFRTVAPYTLEEAHEVVDAIERGDTRELCGELGDLLFQVVFHARMAEEQGWFDFADVVEGICAKMVRRHPHVFGDERHADEEALHAAWEREKHRERSERRDGPAGSLLEGVALALPALVRTEKLQRRAARGGFDWQAPEPVLEKIREELDECARAMQAGEDHAALEEETGDLLFSCVNLARHLGIDAEQALRRANAKFERRFRRVEQGLQERGLATHAGVQELMETLWEAAKSEDDGR